MTSSVFFLLDSLIRPVLLGRSDIVNVGCEICGHINTTTVSWSLLSNPFLFSPSVPSFFLSFFLCTGYDCATVQAHTTGLEETTNTHKGQRTERERERERNGEWNPLLFFSTFGSPKELCFSHTAWIGVETLHFSFYTMRVLSLCVLFVLVVLALAHVSEASVGWLEAAWCHA